MATTITKIVPYKAGDYPTLPDAEAQYFTGEFRKIEQSTTTLADLLNTAWTAYTPTITPIGGTLGTVTAAGRYKKIGHLVFVNVKVTITAIGTMTSWNASVPFAAKSDNLIPGIDQTSGKTVNGNGTAAGSTILATLYDGTKPITNGMVLVFNGGYESVS